MHASLHARINLAPSPQLRSGVTGNFNPPPTTPVTAANPALQAEDGQAILNQDGTPILAE